MALTIVIQQACTSGGDPTSAVSRAATAKYDWMQFGGGPSHSGNNTLEQTITASNVSGLKQLFQYHLPETIEGEPMVLTNVSTSSGTHDVAFMTTRNGYIVALDAYAGTLIWQRQFTGTNITMSSPAIDPSRSFVYAAGIDGKLHKVNIGDGTEVTTGGWPETASLKDSVEKDGTALTIGTSGGVNWLYMGTGGYDGDGGDYQGHLTAVNLSTGAQKVFNAMCSNQTIHFSSSPDCAGQKSGVWAKAGVTFDSLTNRVYMGTGNGTFAPSSFYWGDSILALNPDGSGAGNGNPLDSYTPSVYQTLQNNDKDLGSTNMLILVNNGSKYPHLGMQSGKDAVVRLINLDNMSGQGAPGKVAGEVASAALTTGGEVQNPCATWINPADNKTWMYISSPSNGVNAYQLAVDGGGNPSLSPMWHQSTANNGGVTVANGVLYYASNNNLHALSPTTGAQLWNATSIGQIHWQTPTVANGVVYIGDNGREVTAFGFGGGGTGSGGSGGGTGSGGSGGAGGSALPRTGWTATASNTGGGDVPANALDGNTGTRWSTGAAMANGMWYQVDMQSARSFDQLTMDSAGSTNDYARGYTVAVSSDGATFTSVASGTGTAALITVSFPQQSARYIKITQTGAASNWWSIAELNVYSGSGGGTGAGGSTGSAGSGGAGT
ncbi:MAG TPA: discoidin domain-containing protein, partial [Polyangia bacterium]|nr:discoidin domain-containing protein [Polyangia bacterium]